MALQMSSAKSGPQRRFRLKNAAGPPPGTNWTSGKTAMRARIQPSRSAGQSGKGIADSLPVGERQNALVHQGMGRNSVRVVFRSSR